MTSAQAMTVRRLLETNGPHEGTYHTFHHGDCIGADWQAGSMAWVLGYQIVLHPPEDDSKRAFFSTYTVIREPLPYLDRNRIIVDETRLLIATPKEEHEVVRSGTWMTIRYARKHSKEVNLVWPNGKTEVSG